MITLSNTQAYSTLPTTNQVTLHPPPSDDQSTHPNDAENEEDSFLSIRRNAYKNQGIISRRTIFSIFTFSFFLILLLFYMSPSSSFSSSSHLATSLPSTINSTSNELFPYTPQDLLNQCHKYYDLSRMPDHSGHYLTSGAGEDDDSGEEEEEEGVCKRTLVYLLDDEKGLFHHLLLIAQSYSLSKLTSRKFFIDDSRWDRGLWIDQFKPLPFQGCKRPKGELMKGCPRGSRHWVVSQSTARYHFAHQYQAYFEDPRGHDVGRKKKMFEMAREAFDEILIPSEKNAELIREAEKTLLDEKGGRKDYIGVQIRRGDRRPMSWKHRNDYIPLEHFVDAVNRSWISTSLLRSKYVQEAAVFVSTDTPSILSTFSNLLPYTFTSLSLLNSTSSSITSLSSPTSYIQQDWNTSLSTDEKIFFTRGMIVDFALLTGSWGDNTPILEVKNRRPSSVICTLSSNICKLAAVALGWKESFEEMRWINVDGGNDFDWRPTDTMG